MHIRRSLTVLLWLLALLVACRPAGSRLAAVEGRASDRPTPAARRTATAIPSPATPPAGATALAPPATPTPLPTTTPSPTIPATATPRPSPTATPLGLCSERQPDDQTLLTLVSRDYGLSRSYEPGDLVPLADTFPNSVTLGYPTQVRAAIIGPLQKLIGAMQAEELSPLIVSGYRDYYAQSLAEQKWVEQYPDWAHNLSAPAGHSEHQLGTTLDFSSPDLPEMVGEEHIQFHPAFARSKEGVWLADNAHRYGFTMSYPADRFEDTAFYYEPWHFRYVGANLATELYEEGLTISEYLLEKEGPPCVP